MRSSIEYLGRRVRIDKSFECGRIGPNGRQIGVLRLVEAGTVGLVTSHRPGLTVRLDDGYTINVTKADVTLLPR